MGRAVLKNRFFCPKLESYGRGYLGGKEEKKIAVVFDHKIG